MRAVFPNERLMLKEHFRCVEPIIRFSMQFYPEKMLPLRIPAAHERLDPPLVDIYVPHGARGKHRKVNTVEADVIVEEIKALTGRPEMRTRTIGVISLVGAEQAEHIRAQLSESIGEEIMQRHAILCGDSATFQGSERDIVYLSMVADSANKTALTMLRYEQRFNVAVSRARDRVVLVRSVNREELNPNDLKARLIAHFENPMPEMEETEDALAACESNFERDLMSKLLERGYTVRGQVGSLGFRIDMVVEGANRTRLAVECDGDRFHGPEQWRQDMRRQRVLERVGWHFWRCFASSFYRAPDAVLTDLVETLTRMGIEPLGKGEPSRRQRRFTEHRIVEPPVAAVHYGRQNSPLTSILTMRRVLAPLLLLGWVSRSATRWCCCFRMISGGCLFTSQKRLTISRKGGFQLLRRSDSQSSGPRKAMKSNYCLKTGGNARRSSKMLRRDCVATVVSAQTTLLNVYKQAASNSCLNQNGCRVDFATVQQNLKVLRVSCTIDIQSNAVNPLISDFELGNTTSDQTSYSFGEYLAPLQLVSTAGTDQLYTATVPTLHMVPAGYRPSVLIVTRLNPSAPIAAQCSISGSFLD
jgi:very-short-patch-repair endonuclease